MFKDRLSVFFLVILVGAGLGFWLWGVDYTGHGRVVLFSLACLFGLFMAFNIGGNDVANSFGTSVGAGTLSIRQAFAVAAIFEVSGAMIAGGAVTDTIRKGIVDLSSLATEARFDAFDFVYIMMASLLAAALWLLLATRRGWPVSTTHSIVGGIVGAAIALGVAASGTGAALALVNWGQIGTIVLSWVVSPLLGGLVAYVLFAQIRKHILAYNEQAALRLKEIHEERQAHKDRHIGAFERLTELQKISYTHAMARDAASIRLDDQPGPDDFESEYYRGLFEIEKKRDAIDAYRALQTHVPVLAAIGATIISAMLLFKGLKHMQMQLSNIDAYLIMLMVGAAVWMTTYILARTLKGNSLDRSTFLLFSWMQVFTASGFAFSHGSNDIANAIGPFAAVLEVLHTGDIGAQAPIPAAAMLTFGIAMIAGLWFIGKEVIATVGTNLTRMHPASGFAAELSAAVVVMVASTFGIPVSSTHILVGAVLGIGVANRATNWNLMKPIALAWVVTLPAAGGLSAACFFALRSIF